MTHALEEDVPALDPSATEISFSALEITGADPHAIHDSSHLLAAVGSIRAALTRSWIPGVTIAITQVALTSDSGDEELQLHVYLALGVAGPAGSTATGARERVGFARAQLEEFPAPWRISSCDPSPLFTDPGSHIARVVQRSHDHQFDGLTATAIVPFHCPPRSQLSLARLVSERPSPFAVRATLLATRPIPAHAADLVRQARVVRFMARQAGDETAAGRTLRRAEIGLLQRTAQMDGVTWLSELAIASVEPLSEFVCAEVAGSVFAQPVTEPTDALSVAPPAGGYTIERGRSVDTATARSWRLGVPAAAIVGARPQDVITSEPGAIPVILPVPVAGPVAMLPTAAAPALAPPARLPREGVTIGRDARGRELRLSELHRARHVHLVGASGSGKSSVMGALAKADLDNKGSGRGFLLIDPHGQLAAQTASYAAERGYTRGRDLFVVDPADPGTDALNVLDGNGPPEARDPERIEQSVARLIDAVSRYLGVEMAGRRFEMNARAAAMLVMYGVTAPSLHHVTRALLDPDYAAEILRTFDGPAEVLDTITNFAGQRESADVGNWAASKLAPFTERAAVNRILAPAGKGVRIADVMRDGAVMIVDLAKGNLGSHHSELLGHLVLSMAIEAGLERPSEESELFSILVDEAHSFVPDTPGGASIMNTALSELRKFSVGLVLAHQHLLQLPPTLRSTVLGGAGTRIAFRATPGDADVLAEELGVLRHQLLGLDDLHGYARLSGGELGARAFSVFVDRPTAFFGEPHRNP